mmetsp:Transcript_51371/g.116838  ORF Transcript_51371/g.116838 Transcript_51371/m.116838 type:complete len:90 (-) Transcript_51371:166-435(-)
MRFFSMSHYQIFALNQSYQSPKKKTQDLGLSRGNYARKRGQLILNSIPENLLLPEHSLRKRHLSRRLTMALFILKKKNRRQERVLMNRG